MRARGAVVSHLVLRLLDVLHVPQVHTRRLRVAHPTTATGSHKAINEAKKHRLNFGFQESDSRQELLSNLVDVDATGAAIATLWRREGEAALRHAVQADTRRPDIGLAAVVQRARKHLRRHVLDRPKDRRGFVLRDVLRQPKVRNLAGRT